MSRQSHLPPRCPLKPASRPIQEFHPQHHNSSSQGSILEEQPCWLDDLLNDQDANSKGFIHRRSASDSVTLLDGLVGSFSGLSPKDDGDITVGNENCSALESSSVYGPNSPRKKSNGTFSENAIASLLSEYVFQTPPEFVDGSLCISGTNHPDSKGDISGSVGESISETNTIKRHSGQRSRVRKLQYIAELERTVDVFQALESELSVRVALLLQQRVALSMENSKLKQQVARLQKEKMIMESQYKSLKKEVARLRNGLANSSNTVRANFGNSPLPEAAGSDATWQVLNIAKLNLD